jgi:hypothetical protein
LNYFWSEGGKARGNIDSHRTVIDGLLEDLIVQGLR